MHISDTIYLVCKHSNIQMKSYHLKVMLLCTTSLQDMCFPTSIICPANQHLTFRKSCTALQRAAYACCNTQHAYGAVALEQRQVDVMVWGKKECVFLWKTSATEQTVETGTRITSTQFLMKGLFVFFFMSLFVTAPHALREGAFCGSEQDHSAWKPQ